MVKLPDIKAGLHILWGPRLQIVRQMLVFIGTPQISSCLKGTSFRKLPHFLTPHGSDACGPPVADENQHPSETGNPDRVFGSKSRTRQPV